jgi:nitrogenase molybdenum-iron protein beta chain
VITDPLDEDLKKSDLEWIKNRFTEVLPEVIFTEDREWIERVIVESHPGIVFGSSVERKAAEKVGTPLVHVSFPIYDQVIIDRGIAGIKGAISFLEEIGTAMRR